VLVLLVAASTGHAQRFPSVESPGSTNTFLSTINPAGRIPGFYSVNTGTTDQGFLLRLVQLPTAICEGN
jgi:hypothetical protein